MILHCFSFKIPSLLKYINFEKLVMWLTFSWNCEFQMPEDKNIMVIFCSTKSKVSKILIIAYVS